MKGDSSSSYSLWQRISFALSGIIQAAKAEKNLQIQLTIAFIVLMLAWLLEISRTEFFIILLLIGQVVSLEMVNTALERVVDLVSDEWHALAKAAKDIAAGAVLSMSVISAIIGSMIFWPTF